MCEWPPRCARRHGDIVDIVTTSTARLFCFSLPPSVILANKTRVSEMRLCSRAIGSFDAKEPVVPAAVMDERRRLGTDHANADAP